MLSTGKLTSFDLDHESEKSAAEIKNSNFNFIRANFSEVSSFFQNSSLDGAIIDCGVSSPQIEQPERGFSFQKKGPFDMKFNNQSGMTCSDIVNKYKEEEISHILWAYGEEEESRRIAKAIVERRSDKPFTNTLDLSDLIKRNKKIRTKKHAATKSFQALRIAVNTVVLVIQYFFFSH